MKLIFKGTIGQGGFGIVDKVQDDAGKYFARKTFRINQGPNFSSDLEDNVRKRFIREAKIQSAISHKNIVPVLYKDLETDPPFFLMPLAINSSENDIRSDRILNGKFMYALIDIIAALEEIHSVQIFHRDLKPANVLRFNSAKQDKRDFYAIGDFGLISVTQTSLPALTQTGMKMGSDYYTAPEIVKSLKNASAQSDIYSIGCILHDFVGIEERVPCNEIRESSDFSAILLNCTRTDPRRRFKSVTSLRDALLSLGDIKIKAKTEKGEEIFKILDLVENDITEKEWKDIVDFVEDEFESIDGIPVLRKLTIQHLENVIKKYPSLAKRLGLLYAKWIREASFPFEECDGLSIRLEKFVENSSIDVQSECIMAMLYLGTSHNRWYVERKFVDLVGKNLGESLAKRLSIEFRVDGEEVKKAINHLENSITFNIENLHPLLLNTFKDL